MSDYSCFSLGSGDSPASGAEALAFRAGPNSSDVVAWDVFEVRPDVGEVRTESGRVIASSPAAATQLSAPSRNCPYRVGLSGWLAWIEGDRVVAVDTTRAIRLTSATPRPPSTIVRSPLLASDPAFDILLLSADATELMLVAVDTTFKRRPIWVPWTLPLPGTVSESAARFGNGPGRATRHVALLADGDRVLHTSYSPETTPSAPAEVRLPEGGRFLNGPISLCVDPTDTAIVTCVQAERGASHPVCRLVEVRFPADGGPAHVGHPTELGTLPDAPVHFGFESRLGIDRLRHEMITRLTNGSLLRWSGGVLSAADDPGPLTDPPLLFLGEQFSYFAVLHGESLTFR